MERAGSSWAEILIGLFLAGAAGSAVCTQLLIKPSQAKSDTFILFPLYSGRGSKKVLKCLEIGSSQSKDRLFGLNGQILMLPGSNTGIWAQRFAEICLRPVPMRKILGVNFKDIVFQNKGGSNMNYEVIYALESEDKLVGYCCAMGK